MIRCFQFFKKRENSLRGKFSFCRLTKYIGTLAFNPSLGEGGVHSISWKFSTLWKFGFHIVTNLEKGQCKIYRPEYIFRKIHAIKLIKSLTHFILPIVCFKSISCQETCKFGHAQMFQISSIGVSKYFY